MKTISPEQQIISVMDALKKRVALPRQQQKVEEIRDIVGQLDNMLDEYFRGELEPIILTNDEPF